jgi:hypothetical protein
MLLISAKLAPRRDRAAATSTDVSKTTLIWVTELYPNTSLNARFRSTEGRFATVDYWDFQRHELQRTAAAAVHALNERSRLIFRWAENNRAI